MAENSETIVVGLLTLLGFALQYRHFEQKISVRDRRDVFFRTVTTPLDGLRSQFVDFEAHLSVGIHKKMFDHEKIFQTAIILSRRFNALTKQLNQSPSFDVGDGWITLSTERFDDALLEFDSDPSVVNAKTLEDAAKNLFEKTDTHLAACSVKAGIDKAH